MARNATATYPDEINMSESEGTSDCDMFSTTAIDERDALEIMEISSDEDYYRAMFNDSEDEYVWDSIDIDQCSVVAQIDDRDQEN